MSAPIGDKSEHRSQGSTIRAITTLSRPLRFLLLAALAFTAAVVVSDLLFDEAAAVSAAAHDHTAQAHETVCIRLAAAPGLCTHGPDVAPPGVGSDRMPSIATINRRIAQRSYELDRTTDTAAYGALAASTRPVVCGTGGPRVQAIYMHHPGGNRYTKMLPTIRQLAMVADDYVNRSAAQVGTGLRIRWATTSDCKVSVKRVSVGTTARNSFNATINALAKAGLNDPDRKYVAWLDTSDGLCGIGTSLGDDSPGQFNANNQTTGFAQINRRCWGGGAEMHELFHTLGAVQFSAPRSTRYGHCRDEQDAMCYLDGPLTKLIKPAPCPNAFEWQLDCGKNDYFHPGNPPASNYLDNHWNTAKSKWLEPDDPPPTAPAMNLPAPSRRLQGLKWALSTFSKSGNGSPVSYRWGVVGYDRNGPGASVPCSFSSKTVRQPVFWCDATFTGPIVLSVTATDGKGLTNATVKHIDFALPDSPLRTVMTVTTNPSSVTKAGTSAVNVLVTATVKEKSTGKPLVGVPVSLYDTVSGASLFRSTNPEGKVRWARSATSRMSLDGSSQAIVTYILVNNEIKLRRVWTASSDSGRFEWKPVFTTPVLTGSTLATTLSPLEPVYAETVKLFTMAPGATSWVEHSEYVNHPFGSDDFSVELLSAPASGTKFQFRKILDSFYGPFYAYGAATSPTYVVP